ncbi:MAG: hypothetical protein IT305_16625 [Chloroflexi bacterium]|nr:hypothetical protein [Chloroflexota bacterium]
MSNVARLTVWAIALVLVQIVLIPTLAFGQIPASPVPSPVAPHLAETPSGAQPEGDRPEGDRREDGHLEDVLPVDAPVLTPEAGGARPVASPAASPRVTPVPEAAQPAASATAEESALTESGMPGPGTPTAETSAQTEESGPADERRPAETASPAEAATPAASETSAAPRAGASPTPTTPATPPPLPSHDWRAPGFVAVVDGQVYDPFCRPLRSAGSNVPNLLFRQGLRENLEWMRQHQMRWFRVIATGHGLPQPHPDARPGIVEQRLAALLGEVEAFNATHSPNEAIYVLVTFTDYYEPGVPGDRYGFDHAGWCSARVLNAPWYRRGITRYGFEQECNGGRLADAPNYEVNFKPWVQRIVAAGARSPALFGWQLGNEMKSRSSPRNGITSDDAYGWYLDWQADMVDTIRAVDRNHLVFAAVQYLAELTDWEYRPYDGLALDRTPRYRELMDRMQRTCGQYCWNVWSLTDYDFRPYSLDDAMLMQRAGIATVITEYGFTLGGTPEEERARFGGDRRAAYRSGMAMRWQDVDGIWHDRQWGTFELIERAGLQGIAPWGSPAPDPSPGFDLDWQRGITDTRDGDLWDVWSEIASRLEAGNQAHGVSNACAAYVSE